MDMSPGPEKRLTAPETLRLVVVISVLLMSNAGRSVARAQPGGRNRITPMEMLEDFQAYCRSMDVRRDTGSAVYHVYAYTTIGRRLDPSLGDQRQVFDKMTVRVFDNDEDLAKAKKEYAKVREAFRRYAGNSQYRGFPFEDRSWEFADFAGAWDKSRTLKRKNLMSYWPGVLGLQVDHSTGAAEYVVFGYQPIDGWRVYDDDECEVSFFARKRRWRLVIFDDQEAAAGAKQRYLEHVQRWSTVNDGKGNPVGHIQPHVERFGSYAEAGRRADELRVKLNRLGDSR